MTSRLRKALAAAVALGVTASVVAFSALPVPVRDADRALLRLSWRLRGEQVGLTDCRRPTAEELAELPAHMRNPDACVGELAPYRLTVNVDGNTLVNEIFEGSGVRHDRPIYVFRELTLEPGPHRIRVDFTRDEAADQGGLELTLRRTVEMEAGTVALITFDADSGTLFLARATPGTEP